MSKLMERERAEQVKEMIGTMINIDGSMDRKVGQRVVMASRMVGAIGSTVLGRKGLSKGANSEWRMRW